MSRDDERRVRIQVGMEDASGARALDDSPFCIALIGDFGARDALADSMASSRRSRVIAFDRDDVDAVMAAIAPDLKISIDGQPEVTIRFRGIDDFHPDRLLERVPLFGALRETRKRLLDPRSSASAVRALTEAPAQPLPAGDLLSGAGLLDRMLDQSTDSPTPGAAAPRHEDDLDAFVRRVVAPHLVAAADPRQAELVAATDAALAREMRNLLHHPTFESLESSWRTAEFLARRIETGSRLRLYLLDVSRAELNADLDATADPLESMLCQRLADAAAALPDGGRWSVLAGLFSFSGGSADATRLSSLAEIAHALGAPWISAAAPGLLGLRAFAELLDDDAPTTAEDEAWSALRASPTSHWVGLAAPRFLVRLPYGRNGEPVDAFPFEEEDPAAPVHLWGNPAAACALLLAESFAEDDWNMRAGSHVEIRGLPLHTYRRDGEFLTLPCAETLMSEEGVDRLLDAGVMPLVSFRDSDTVRLARFQSIARPAAALNGPWTRAR